MAIQYEFISDVQTEILEIPKEIFSRLKIKGISKIKVLILPFYAENDELASKGITQETIEQIAAIQKYDKSIAIEYLNAEGSVKNNKLKERLKNINVI